MKTLAKAESKYNQLVDAYMKNEECIRALQVANEGIKREVETVLNEINPILESYIQDQDISFPDSKETRLIYCSECDCDYEDDIALDSEITYLWTAKCSHCGCPGNLTITGPEEDQDYNPRTDAFSDL